MRDQARRFIVLLDELYNHRCRLVCSAAAAPDGLFAGADSSEPIIDLESLQARGGLPVCSSWHAAMLLCHAASHHAFCHAAMKSWHVRV